jgi:hypothetical protein
MKKSKLINPDPTLKNNLMAFGYECDKGWWPLIDECIEKLEEEAKKTPFNFEILQIKEKYGTLRIYLSSENDSLFGIVERYELFSSHLCELCGEFWTAKERRSANGEGGWFKTLCLKCAKENDYA